MQQQTQLSNTILFFSSFLVFLTIPASAIDPNTATRESWHQTAGSLHGQRPGMQSSTANPRSGTAAAEHNYILQSQGGQPAGTVTAQEHLILLELDADRPTPANLFDLEGTTLRFTPDGDGYRVEALPLQWDAVFGSPIAGSSPVQIVLSGFQFPFSQTNWSTLFVNPFGTITFGGDQSGFFGPQHRFLLFQDFGRAMQNTLPIISALFRRYAFGPGDVSQRYIKQLSDRVVITWSLSELFGFNQDFTYEPNVNRFQAVLHADGSIELSYDEIAVRDGIVGVYSLSTEEQFLAKIVDPEDPQLPEYIDTISVTASLVGGNSIRLSFQTRGPILPEGNPIIDSLFYRAWIDLDEPFITGVDFDDPEFVWQIASAAALTYFASGPGASAAVEINGDTISLTASAQALGGVDQFAFFVDVVDFDDPAVPFDQTTAVVVTLPELQNPTTDLSAATAGAPQGSTIFESFHYVSVPGARDLACAVIGTLGDRFDFLAFYSDFRIDSQEAGTTSTGAIGDSVTGFGQETFGSAQSFCSDGRIQATYSQPVYIESNQALPEAPDGSFGNYNLQMAQLSHELGHRWMAFADAIVQGNRISLGPVHWTAGLHAPVPFPYLEVVQASSLGGGFWVDNHNGSFTRFADAFYIPASGYSYLDLYFMGLLRPGDVPDMFLIENLVFSGFDGGGNQVWSGSRLNITIDDVIAANGPRLPAFKDAQKVFNTGFVGMVMNGNSPTPALLERMGGIREQWIKYWSIATGSVSTMTVSPCPEFELVDCDNNGIPDGCAIADGTSEDCNDNTIPDSCDLTDGASLDCNTNTVPDECDIADGTSVDCNANTIPDACDLSDSTSLDCNTNTVPDECDIDSDVSGDLNGNGVPDECEVTPALEAAPPHDTRKNRVISINPNNTNPVVMKVELLDRACSTSGAKCANDVDCDSGETCDEQSTPVMLGWVSDPITLGAASQMPSGAIVTRVQKEMPEPRVWSETIVHVSGCEIAPVQSYAISASTDGLIFSQPLRIGTIKKPEGKEWADYVSTVESGVFAPPNGILNVNDLSALLAFFQGRTVSDLEYVVTTLELVDETPTFVISASDLQAWLGAFGGGTYPPPAFANQGGPENCP